MNRAPSSMEVSSYSVLVDGHPVPVEERFSPDPKFQYVRRAIGIVRFDFAIEAEVEVKFESDLKGEAHSNAIRDVDIVSGAVRFKFSRSGQCIVMGEGLPTLLIVADPADKWRVPEGAICASEVGIVPDDGRLQSDAINAKLRDLSLAGGGTLYFPAGDYLVSTVKMQSHVTVHLELGARLVATTDIEAYEMDPEDHVFRDVAPSLIPGVRRRVVFWENCDNAALVGLGSVEGSGSEMRRLYFKAATAEGREVINLMRFQNARNCRVEGVTLADSEFWNTHILLSEGILFDYVKVINERVARGWAKHIGGPYAERMCWNNTDGLNPDSSQRVTIRNSLLHTGDDCVAVKNTGGYRNELRDSWDIHVHDNLMICGTTSMKLGTETRGSRYDHIVFEDNYVAHCSRPIGVELKDSVTVRNYRVENITVASCNRPFDLEIMVRGDEENQVNFANLDGAVLRNIDILKYKNEGDFWHSHIRGLSEEHQIRNVLLESITLEGDTLTSLDHPAIVTNAFIEDICIR